MLLFLSKSTKPNSWLWYGTFHHGLYGRPLMDIGLPFGPHLAVLPSRLKISSGPKADHRRACDAHGSDRWSNRSCERSYT